MKKGCAGKSVQARKNFFMHNHQGLSLGSLEPLKIRLKKFLMACQNVLMKNESPTSPASSIWVKKLPVPGSRYAYAFGCNASEKSTVSSSHPKNFFCKRMWAS